MPLAVFAISVLGLFLWLLFVTILLPPLLGRLVGAILSRVNPVRVSLSSLRIYPLSGTLAISGLRVATCDAVFEAHSATLTARWWRRNPAPDAARHPAAAVPAVFVLVFEGTRVRVVNNSAAYDALEAALRSGAVARDGAPRSPQLEPHALLPQSTPAWLLSRTSVRVTAGAVYVYDVKAQQGEAGAKGVVRLAVRSLKMRQAVHEVVDAQRRRVRREAMRASVSGLRICVLSEGDSLGAEEAQGRAEGRPARGADGSGPDPRGPTPSPRWRRLWHGPWRARWRMPWRGPWKGRLGGRRADGVGSRLDRGGVSPACCPIFWATKAVVELAREGPVVQADWVGSIEAKVVLSHAQFCADQRALAAAQAIGERISPPLFHLGKAGASGAGVRVPLTVVVEVSPAPDTPFVTVPFMPRLETWHVLRALELRNWTCDAASPVGNGRSVPVETALPPSSMDLSGTKMVCTVGPPAGAEPGVAEEAFQVNVEISDVKLGFSGVVDLPFIHARGAHVTYREQAQDSWASKRSVTIDVDLDEPLILYVMDCARCCEDIAYAVDAHARIPDSVSAFVPYELTVRFATNTGYCLRLPIQEANAWSTLSSALSKRLEHGVAEIRGVVGTVTISSASALEYSPLVAVTKWNVELPDAELFFVLPFVGASRAPEEEQAPSPKSGRRHGLRRPSNEGQRNVSHGDRGDPMSYSGRESGLSGRLRSAFDDAAVSFSRFGLTSVFVTERNGDDRREEEPPSPPCHSFRVAQTRNGFSLFGENSVHVADVPLAAQSSSVHLRAGNVVVDANPYHLPFALALIENIAGSITHSLSYDERDAFWQRRRVLERELACIDRVFTQLEALTLGLVAGRLPLGADPPLFETSSLNVGIDSLCVRLHDVPSAMCPLLADARCLNIFDLAGFQLSSEMTPTGMFIQAGPASSGPLATLRNVTAQGAFFDEDSEDPAITTSRWSFEREILFDELFAPYSMQTYVELGNLIGTLPVANVVALARFLVALKDAPGPAVSPTMEAMWGLNALHVNAAMVDILLPICDSWSMDAVPGVAHVCLGQGFRSCVNNLGAAGTGGHSSFSVPVAWCNAYTCRSVDKMAAWEGEANLRASISSCENCCVDSFLPNESQGPSDLVLATRVLPLGVVGRLHERPPLWSPRSTIRQRLRLEAADRTHQRCRHLWSPDLSTSFPRPSREGIELYDVPWWVFSAYQHEHLGVSQVLLGRTDSLVLFHQREAHLSLLGVANVIAGPGLVAITRKYILQRRKAPREEPHPPQATEGDIVSVWRSSAREWLAEQEQSLQKAQMKISLEGASVKLMSPLSVFGKQSAIFSEEAVSDPVSPMKDDIVMISLPHGSEVALSNQIVPLDDEEDRLPYSLAIVKMPSVALFVGRKDRVVFASGIDLQLRKSGQADSEWAAVRARIRSFHVGTPPGKDLTVYSRLGRALTVYALMVRSLAEQVADDAERDFSRRLYVAQALGSIENAMDRNGIACSSVYFLRRRARAVPVSLPFFNVPLEPEAGSQLIGVPVEVDAIWEAQCCTLVDSPAIPTAEGGSGVQLRSTLPCRGGIEMALLLNSFDFSILGQSVAEVREMNVDGMVGGDEKECGVLNISCSAFSLAIRDDIIAGLLNVASTIASHATKTVANVRFLQVDDGTHGHVRTSLPLSDSTKSVRIDEERALGERALSQPRASRASTALKALRRSKSRQSTTKPLNMRDFRRTPHLHRSRASSGGIGAKRRVPSVAQGFHGLSSVLRFSGEQAEQDEGAQIDRVQHGSKLEEHGRRPWLSRVSHRAELYLHMDHSRRSGVESPGAVPSGEAKGKGPTSPIPVLWTKLTVILSCGIVDMSYRRSRRVQRKSANPDVRVTIRSTSGSFALGAGLSAQSLLLIARTIALVSENEANCVFRGSIASVRTCASVSPGRQGGVGKTFVSSVRFLDVDLCLEAADIWSVLVFQERFKEDVRSIGESVVTTDASIRTMLRAIGMSHVVERSPDEVEPVVSGSAFPSFDSISIDAGIERISTSLVGFHPADKAMRITHEAASVFVSATVSETATAVLVLGGRISGHCLVISASQWSSEERFVFPSLDLCGVQWSWESELPTQVKLTTGPAVNLISFQGLRNVLFTTTGLLAFQSEPGRRPPSTMKTVSQEKMANVPDVCIQEGSTISRAMIAWERTKAVRMEMLVASLRVGLESAGIVLTVDVGNVAGTVEWNRFVKQGPQLLGALEVSTVSLIYAHSSSMEADLVTHRDKASSTVDFIGGRVDLLKSQAGLIHKFVFRLTLESIESVIKPWQFMEDAAVWSDEQEFIKEIQAIHMGTPVKVANDPSGRTVGNQPLGLHQSESSIVRNSANHEHRLLEAGLEIGSARCLIPLFAEETIEESRLCLELHEVYLQARLGDEVALPSQLNLTRVRIRSMGILWAGANLFNSSQAQFTFAVKRSPQAGNAHLGSLRGSVSLGSWVVCPRQEVVLAIVDARFARQVRATRLARAKLVSIPDLLTRPSGVGAATAPPVGGELRLLFEHVEVVVLPSPGFIEGWDMLPVPKQHRRSRSLRSLRPIASASSSTGHPSSSSRLQLPIPMFSIGLVRSPLHKFDLLDVTFSARKNAKFPERSFKRVANLFSELFGSIASRTTLEQDESLSGEDVLSRNAGNGFDANVREATATHLDMQVRDWSALVRFGESKYVAQEDIYGRLQTRFSFYAGEGSGILASTLPPGKPGALGSESGLVVPGKATVVAAVSPLFRLEIQPELETASVQSLALTGVKFLQGYANGLAPRALVHISETKAELDIVTLLLSREWITRKRLDIESDSKSSGEAISPTPAHQAALALASATPSETKVVVVLGDAMAGDSSGGSKLSLAREGQSIDKPKNRALLLRLRLSQPEGRVGLVVKRVILNISRERVQASDKAGSMENFLESSMHLSIHQVTSLADWEHLSSNSGFHSLHMCGNMERAAQSYTGELGKRSGGAALVVHKLRLKCERDGSDAFKLEVDGCATAAGVTEGECQVNLETTNVDTYISSLTIKTVNRLRQLQSRLRRGLRPQVERLLLAELRRDRSQHSASIDSLNFGIAREKSWRSQGTIPVSDSIDDAGTKLVSAHSALVPGRISVSGDKLVLTMHGFSFDDNQPQAKLLFVEYDVDYVQRPVQTGDMDMVQDVAEVTPSQPVPADWNLRRLSMRYDLLDIQYSDQRQKSITVMSLPDPHLNMRIFEVPGIAVVEFLTMFERTVEISASVSHYDYLNQLLTLYRSATRTSFSRTLSAIGKTNEAVGSDVDGLSERNISASNLRRLEAGSMAAPSEDTRSIPTSIAGSEGGGSSRTNRRVRWGGRRVVFKNVLFAPQLSPLGDLTPDVSSVLGWLGVGEIEALPGGLYDIIVEPMSIAVNNSVHVLDMIGKGSSSGSSGEAAGVATRGLAFNVKQ